MTYWLDPEPIDAPADLQEEVGAHPLVAETLVRRGIRTPAAARAFLDPNAYTPADPTDLPDLEKAVDLLLGAIHDGRRIAVWGDFDADGQTATALLWQTLLGLGADAVYRVPTRDEGHGLHEGGLLALIAAGARLVLTCDCGISAHDAVARAQALGAQVIITDHHVPTAVLPAAEAVINPHRLPAEHALATLPGVGVAYELARALDPALADQALDLVALGTIADVAALRGDTRYLVQRGLEALRHTTRAGLLAIYQAAELHPEGITEEHVGFVLAPRLNALGRLADAAAGVDLLTTVDRTHARILATEVEGLNARRQWLTKQVTDAALAVVDRDPTILRDDAALVLSHPSWPEGITGLVAGRLAERFGKPTVLISTPQGRPARGSGRSVPGIDLIAALSTCAPLLLGFGGHAGAAGFSLDADRIPELQAGLSRAVAKQGATLAEPTLTIDAYVELPGLTLDLVADLSRLAPFGAGNPPLTLALRDVQILSEAAIGRHGEHRRIIVEDGQERSQTVFWWQGSGWPLPQGRFDLACTVRASDYRGLSEVQVEWLQARELALPDIESVAAPALEIWDLRTAADPLAALNALAGEGVQIWAEGDRPAGIQARGRARLMPAQQLAIWTAPPGPRELRAALGQAQPGKLILFAIDPGLDTADAFLHLLAGMVKHALRARDGLFDLTAAAERTSQRASTVRAGLELLAARTQILILDRGDRAWRIAVPTAIEVLGDMGGLGKHADPHTSAGDVTVLQRLEALLAETAAYRAYFRRSPAADLLRT